MDMKKETDETEQGPLLLRYFLYGGCLMFGLAGAPLLIILIDSFD